MFFFQRPRTIRGCSNHWYVNKYMYFPIQIHSCKTLSFLENSNIKCYPKRVLRVFSQRPRTIRGYSNHSFASKYMYFPLQIHSCKTLSFLEKSNIKLYPKRVLRVFSQCPRTIRGCINHSYVNKYMYFPLQIHSCKTLSFLEKSNIKPYPKRVLRVFSQRPRTIRDSSNHSYVSKYMYFPLQIHSCKTLSFLEKSNIKRYPKRVLCVFSQRPRTIMGCINHSYVNKYMYFPLQIHSCKTLSFLEKKLYETLPQKSSTWFFSAP